MSPQCSQNNLVSGIASELSISVLLAPTSASCSTCPGPASSCGGSLSLSFSSPRDTRQRSPLFSGRPLSLGSRGQTTGQDFSTTSFQSVSLPAILFFTGSIQVVGTHAFCSATPQHYLWHQFDNLVCSNFQCWSVGTHFAPASSLVCPCPSCSWRRSPSGSGQ